MSVAAGTKMFKKILIANRGDNAAGVAAQAGFAQAMPAAARMPGTRSVRGD